MKKTIALSMSILNFFTLNASAAIVGPYIGVGGGYGLLRTPDSHVFINDFGIENSHSRGGIAGRGFIGYTFNKYFGIEAGYAAYTSSHYNASLDGFFESSLRFEANTADVVAKAYLPFGTSGFDIYILGGAARVFETIKFVSGGIPTNFVAPAAGTTSQNATRPIYGAGASYEITCNLVANAEYTQIQRDGSSDTNTPFINLATLNISYHFG
jgi:opacity protein-like surface antigen